MTDKGFGQRVRAAWRSGSRKALHISVYKGMPR
jgi:hypothetical protein